MRETTEKYWYLTGKRTRYSFGVHCGHVSLRFLAFKFFIIINFVLASSPFRSFYFAFTNLIYSDMKTTFRVNLVSFVRGLSVIYSSWQPVLNKIFKKMKSNNFFLVSSRGKIDKHLKDKAKKKKTEKA